MPNNRTAVPPTTEDRYDALIAPLMAQVITLAKQHNIPMFATFQLEDGTTIDGLPDPLWCTSAWCPEGCSPLIWELRRVMGE